MRDVPRFLGNLWTTRPDRRGYPQVSEFPRNVPGLPFLIQATVPKDTKFEKDAIICRRWGYQWKSDGKSGLLQIAIGPQEEGQEACRGKKATRNTLACK